MKSINIKKIDEVSFISIVNNQGLSIVLSTFGASIFQLETIDHLNRLESIVLTPDSLNDFYYSDAYFGKCVGRFSGRINNGVCKIDGKQYVLDKNWNDMHSLHGGKDGISFKNFDYEIKENKEYVDVIFKYLELENLLPGDVNYKITYRISLLKNEFTIFFNAISNKDTLINLTNHAYFNLSGNIKKTILDHKLKLNCDYYTDLDETLITKEIKPVDKIMDFRRFKKIGKDIFNPQIHDAAYKGYDHCFIRQNKSKNNDVIAILKDPLSKRKLTVKTSYPSIVCYTCNYPANITINGNKINQHQSICLECQYIPNGINMENVNKAIFKANEIYEEYITYQFDN